MKHIVILGGGIAGLAAAYRIQEEIKEKGTQVRCTVLEASNHWGGKIHTIRKDGFILERGPDSFISQKPQGVALCRKLGLTDHLLGTKTRFKETYVYLNGRMVTLPDGLSLMVPTKFLPFVTTRLFSWPGKIRMGMEVLVPARRSSEDESLAGFVRRRLGQEAVERLAQPLLAGIYAGNPETMSLKSTFPMFQMTEKKYKSLTLGMLARKKEQMARAQNGNNKSYQPFSMFVTLKNGLSEMVEAIIDQSPDITFRNNARVTGFSKNETGYDIRLENDETLHADAVIVATPASVTARILEGLSPKISEKLDSIPFVSTAAVVLGYEKKGFSHPLKGYGFVVPATEKRRITACTWVSSKFPERAPDDKVLLRAFVGGALWEPNAEKSEQEILQMVKEELADIMGVTQEPLFAHVFRYKKGNVQYHVHHSRLVDEIEQELEKFPGLLFAGSAYRGIGIPDCVQSGTQAAEKTLQTFQPE